MEHQSALLDQLKIERSTPNEPSTGRRLWWVLGAIVLLAAGLAVWLYARAADAIPVQVTVARAIESARAGQAGAALLDATGYVVPLRQASVSAKNIYKVEEVLVEEGQSVKRGQIMARLDDSNARAELDQAHAQVTQAQAALDAARTAVEDTRPVYERDRSQLAEGLISQEAFDNAKTTFDTAQAQVKIDVGALAAARAAVEFSQRSVDDTVIRAPFDGVVTLRNAQPGDIVSPQFAGGGGIAKLVDMDSLEVDVDVSENFINRVHAGQPATITLNAYPDWTIPADVIAVIPTADRAKATVKVRVAFKQKDARVVPDMGAHVVFLADTPVDAAAGARTSTASTPSGVLVAADAVQANGDQGQGTVYLLDGNRVERRSVKLGIKTGDDQIVLSGITDGMRIAMGDFAKLSDGARVRVTP